MNPIALGLGVLFGVALQTISPRIFPKLDKLTFGLWNLCMFATGVLIGAVI